MKMANKIEHKVKDFINKYEMVNSQDRIVIGVSGGADSVCLLFALKSLMKELEITLFVAHVNHGLRGEYACRDERFVKALSKKLDLPCYIVRVDAGDVARKEKLSIEEAGRILRREYFQEVKEKTGSNKIALAHHINDNVETFVMNLARGSGLRGVAGIKPVNGDYIRPLLCLTRSEIEEELKEKGISFCIDETNADNRFMRNRIRNVIIPNLEKLNSKAVLHIDETINHLREVEEFMEERVMEELSRVTDRHVFVGNKEGMELEHPRMMDTQDIAITISNKITTFPLVIQKGVIKKVMEEISKHKPNFTGTHIKQIQELFSKQVGRSLDLPYGLVVVRDYQGVVIYQKSKLCISGKGTISKTRKKNESNGKEAFEGVVEKNAKEGFEIGNEKSTKEVAINIPGITKIPSFNLTIECRFIPDEEKNSYQPSHSLYTKSIDYDIMKSGLSLRVREPKDVITIDKKGSRQKLKSYFINEKVPSGKRDYIPLLVDDEEVVWIIGYRMNMKYQLGPNTKTILEIKIHKEDD